MANAIYPLYKQALLTLASTDLDLDQTTANIAPYAVLIDTGVYTYNTAHQFKSSLTGIVGPTDGVQITTPTVSVAATFDGADCLFTSVTGATVEGFVIYRHTAAANTTWPLVMYYDAAGGGLPVTPNGGNITIAWSASGIFTL